MDETIPVAAAGIFSPLISVVRIWLGGSADVFLAQAGWVFKFVNTNPSSIRDSRLGGSVDTAIFAGTGRSVANLD